MKKAIVCLVLVFVLVFALVGCDHEHEYGEWKIEKAATCTEKGEKVRACECGEKQYEDIPALGHNYVDGTCTECGAKQN